MKIPHIQDMRLLHGVFLWGLFWWSMVPCILWTVTAPGSYGAPEIVLLRWAVWMVGFVAVPLLAFLWAGTFKEGYNPKL